MPPNPLTQLRQIIERHFDDEEMHTLCFDLGIDYDSLGAQGKAAKARELVAYLARHGRLDELIELGRQQRPDIDWEAVPAVPSGAGLDLVAPQSPGEPLSGQVTAGDHVIQIASVHGGEVNLASPQQQPRLRSRPSPVLLRPRPFRRFLNRENELQTLSGALQRETPVDLYGEAGLGKTCLLRYLTHHPPEETFPDGIVYLSARHTAPSDLLQSLLEAFYESDQAFKATETQIRHRLQDKRALIVLDDVELKRDEIEGLMDGAPTCTFVVASSERKLWGEGQALPLAGLPLEHAQPLIERELSRSLTPQEQPAVERLHAALAGHPLRLIQAAALAREEGRTLDEVARQAQALAPGLEAKQLEQLSTQERQIVEALAALKGAPLPVEHLSAMTGLEPSQVEPALDVLGQRGLLQAHSPRYSLTGSLNETVAQTWDLSPAIEWALLYFIHWAEIQNQVAPILSGTEAISQVMSWALQAGHWQEALRLGLSVERAFALGARWGAWRQVLQGMLAAARELGNQAIEAWAQHQLGSRALCLGQVEAARAALNQALALRQALGDQAGAATTHHNLSLLTAPPPPAQQPPESPSTAPPVESAARGIPLTLKMGGIVLLILALAAAGGYLILSDTTTLWVENGPNCDELAPSWDPLLSGLPGVTLFDNIPPGDVGQVKVPTALLGDVQVETHRSQRGLKVVVKTRIGSFSFEPEGRVADIELDGRPIPEGKVYKVPARSEHLLTIICQP